MQLMPEPTVEREAPALVGLRACLDRVLRSGRPEVNRLSYARSSVCFRVAGDGEVTLLLDRRPPVVADAGEPAEIEIELTLGQAESFARGVLFLPGAIARGEIPTRGPVRQYLEVDPILRGLLSDRSSPGEAADPRESENRAPGEGLMTIAPDLLAIETRDLQKAFGTQQVLSGASLTIPEGVIAVVLGPSGTGKSVLLQHIIGLLRPDAGEVIIRGRPLSRMSRSEVLRLRTEIGVMFQDGALFSAMNVYDNVAFPLRQHTNLGENEVRELVMERLEAVGLANAAKKLPAALSGGMKKRAGLARALVLQPSIVLCDEPDSGLDPVRTALLGELLTAQHAEVGGTMVVITHDVSLARSVGEHISVLWHGGIIASGMREEMFDSEDEFVRQFLAGDSEGPLGMDA